MIGGVRGLATGRDLRSRGRDAIFGGVCVGPAARTALPSVDLLPRAVAPTRTPAEFKREFLNFRHPLFSLVRKPTTYLKIQNRFFGSNRMDPGPTERACASFTRKTLSSFVFSSPRTHGQNRTNTPQVQLTTCHLVIQYIAVGGPTSP